MKLRTAYFCRRCDEEVDLEKILKENKCSLCGYKSCGISRTIVYEWKVEVQNETPSKTEIIHVSTIGKFEEGASCPIDTLDRINKGVDKLNEST